MSRRSSALSTVSPAEKEKSTVIIIDEMEIRRSGVVSLLGAWAESGGLRLTSVGLDEAVPAIESGEGVCMIVFNAGGDPITSGNTINYLEQLRAQVPDIPLVIMSDHLRAEDIAAALQTGAMGYVHTGSVLELAMRALSFIIKGGSYFPISVLRELQRRAANHNGPGGDRSNGKNGLLPRGLMIKSGASDARPINIDDRTRSLTPRQAAVLECLCHGDSNKLIARRLSVSETTVKVHVRQIMRKLGAANRTQAAVLTCNATQSDAA
jgi:DNA-binding NarL/FixJ family response regulator